jgi:hypothetical protein
MSHRNYVPGVGEVVFPPDVVEAVAGPGQKDAIVAETLGDARVRAILDRISRAAFVDSLLGIWTLSELEAATIDQLEARFVWIVCCNAREDAEEEERAKLEASKAAADAAARACPVRRVRAVIVVTFAASSFEEEEKVIEALDGTTACIHTELADMGVEPSVWLDDVFGGHTAPAVFSPSDDR